MRQVHTSRTAVIAILIVAGLTLGACKTKPPGIPIAAGPAATTPTTTPAPNVVPCEAPAVTLTANSNTINVGQASTLTWQAFNADSLRIEPGLGAVALTGNRQVSPQDSVTYTATATSKCGVQSGVTRITVNAQPAQRPVDIVRVDPLPTTKDPGVTAPTPPSNPGNPGNRGGGVTTTTARTNDEGLKNILFDYDKAEIRPDQMTQLQADANYLKSHPTVRVIVEGHADERGNQEYNLALGVRRANTIVQYLVAQGVQETRIRSISYGKERPECRDESESCHQKNRRAAFTEAR